MNEYEIIVSPHISEKSTEAAAQGQYAFVVNNAATKIDIKNAVEKIFNVKVLSVNTMRYDGKKRTRNGGGGAIVGYTPKWKKAVVRIDTDPKTVEYTVNGQKKTKKFKSVIEDYGFTQ
jgi:large subunit ribosomal protein L23